MSGYDVAAAAEPKRGRAGWLLRLVGFVVFIVIGSFAAKGRPESGIYYDGTSEIVEALIVGAVVAFILLFLIGSLGLLVSRARGRSRSWRQVVFGRAAMLTTLALLVVSAAGRTAQHEEAVNTSKPNPAGSLSERERANRDAAAWGAQLQAPDSEERAWLAAHRAFTTLLQNEGNTPKTRAKARAARAHVQHALALARAVPGVPEQDLNGLRDMLAQVLQLQLQGYDLYLTGLNRNARSGKPLSADKTSIAFLDEGDALLNRAVRLAQRFRQRALALDAKYGIP